MLSQKTAGDYRTDMQLIQPVFIQIGSKKYLNQSLQTKNPREDAVKIALLNLGIPSYYEYRRYPLSNGKAYFPDFTTSLSFNGRQVILEPHGGIDNDYMKKLKEFIVQYNFYVVVISNKNISKLKQQSIDPRDFVDEYWFINKFENSESEIKYNSRKVEKKLKSLLRKQEVEKLV